MFKSKKLIRVITIALLVIFLAPLAMARAERADLFYPGGKLEGEYFDLEVKVENKSHDGLPEKGDKVHITYTVTNKTDNKYNEIFIWGYFPDWFKYLMLDEFPCGTTKVIEKDVVVDSMMRTEGITLLVKGNVFTGGGNGYTLKDYLDVDIWRLPKDMPEEWKQKEEPVEPAEPEESAEAPEEENKSYKDIPEWAEEEFQKAVEMGIAKGYDDEHFGSDDLVSRAEFSTFLARALKAEGGNQTNFKDEIPEWAVRSVSAIADLGYMKGYPDGTFGANETITRTEAVAVIGRTIDVEHYGTVKFTDADKIPEWAKKDVDKAELAGIVQGDSQGRFNPDKQTTRLESVLMIVRAIDK